MIGIVTKNFKPYMWIFPLKHVEDGVILYFIAFEICVSDLG